VDTALWLKDFYRAGTDLEKCLTLVDRAVADAKKGQDTKVPVYDMRQVRLKGDNFYAQDNPVILVGPLGFSGAVGMDNRSSAVRL